MRSVMIILIIFFPCFAIDNRYECISLGEVCTTAAALEAFELRNAAYPFDWVISPYESLCGVLRQDFKDWLNPAYLSIRDDHHGIINKYGFAFVHDFPTINYVGDPQNELPLNGDVLNPNWIDFVSDVQQKYGRRIQRFRDVCASNKKIYFIRHGGIRSREEARILRNILKTAYTTLDFTLVIVGNDESFTKPWKEKNIKNYHLKKTAVWNDVAEWKKIFFDLGLAIPLTRTHLQEKMDYYYRKYATYIE
jgi:hypothetical protein